MTARAGWLLGLGEKKQTLPEIVKAGDPVLHEPARDVPLKEIGSERIQKIIDDMVKVMRTAPGVGLAAPQIGIPLKVISKDTSFSHTPMQGFSNVLSFMWMSKAVFGSWNLGRKGKEKERENVTKNKTGLNRRVKHHLIKFDIFLRPFSHNLF